MGVSLRGAQPCRSNGAIKNADSSRKTGRPSGAIGVCSSRAPFELDPGSDGSLIALQGAPCGFLRTSTQSTHQPPDVVDVIAHAKSRLNGLCDTHTGPQIRWKASSNRAFEQQFLRLVFLSIRQFGRSPGSGIGLQGLRSLFAIRSTLAAHTLAIDFQFRGNSNRLIAVLEQLIGALAAALQGFGISGRSLGASPAERIEN